MTTNNESELSLELAWAKVLLKSCLDVLETHNEPIVKRLRNDVSDFLKDDYNLLKNQKKFNTSEGNVKDDNIFYRDCCDKFIDYVKKSHNERVADTSKTIDHIADVSKKVSLTEQWKNGELENGWYYYKRENSKIEICYQFKALKYPYNIKGDDIDDVEEVLAPVPSFEQWQSLNELLDSMKDTNKVLAHKIAPFTDPYFRGLTTKDIAELVKKSIRLCKQSCEDNTTIQNLKELLGYCADVLEEWDDKDRDIEILLEEVDEVLK